MTDNKKLVLMIKCAACGAVRRDDDPAIVSQEFDDDEPIHCRMCLLRMKKMCDSPADADASSCDGFNLGYVCPDCKAMAMPMVTGVAGHGPYAHEAI